MLEAVRCRLASGEEARRPIRHLFLFIGADPNSDWLSGCVTLDPKGFVLTGESCATERQLLETGRRGVFAIGDVRAGSVKRVVHWRSDIAQRRTSTTNVTRRLLRLFLVDTLGAYGRDCPNPIADN